MQCAPITFGRLCDIVGCDNAPRVKREPNGRIQRPGRVKPA